MLALLLSSSLITNASAFCGTYVGGVGAELYNSYSQLSVVREDNDTTLTIVNNVEGNFDSFALVLPVPEVIPEENINVLDPSIFDRLDAYSQPRLVTYTCEDFEVQEDTGWVLDSAESPNAGGGDGGVEVEALYIVGEFEIVILSATESDSLFNWLNDNNYQVPGQSQPLLQEYIDSGSYFLAAKVASDAGIADGDTLSPLQFKYTDTNSNANTFQIPIRIGTLNAKEAQDLIIYAVNDYDRGRVGISNYPEFAIEDECMWASEEDQSFEAYYVEQFGSAYAAQEDGAWTVEYAWGGGGCDPCSGTPPDATDLVSLGMNEDVVHYSNYFFTRLHVRYTPAQATEELMLYHSNILDNDQYRFIEYKWELEDRFPVCGSGMVDEPGSCNIDNPDATEDTAANTSTTNDGCGGGCASGGSLALSAWLMGVWGLSRRRRSVS